VTPLAALTTVQSTLRWSDDPAWKLDCCNVERLSEIRRPCRNAI